MMIHDRLLIQPTSNNFFEKFSHLSNFSLKLMCVSYLVSTFSWKMGHIVTQTTALRQLRCKIAVTCNRSCNRRPLFMMTSSNGNIFRVTGPLCGEFTGPGEFPAQRPVTRSFDVFFHLRLNKRLSKQPWGWWFETPPWSLCRQCNVMPLPCGSWQVKPAIWPHRSRSTLAQVMTCCLTAPGHYLNQCLWINEGL